MIHPIQSITYLIPFHLVASSDPSKPGTTGLVVDPPSRKSPVKTELISNNCIMIAVVKLISRNIVTNNKLGKLLYAVLHILAARYVGDNSETEICIRITGGTNGMVLTSCVTQAKCMA